MKLIQRITKGTLRATEAWTDGRHGEDVQMDYELAVALASVTGGLARATVLKATQTEPSRGFVAWPALVHGYAPKSSNDPAIALQPILATPNKCKDAKQLKEMFTAWSLNVAEYEHQFQVIDEAQKIFVVREMMPKYIKREFLTGPRKFDEIMEKLEIIINEMMADGGPVPMDLGNVSGMTRSRNRATRTPAMTCHLKTCVLSLAKGTMLAREQARRDRMGQDQDHGIVEKELMNGRVARKMMEVRKETRRTPRAANPIGTATRTKEDSNWMIAVENNVNVTVERGDGR